MCVGTLTCCDIKQGVCEADGRAGTFMPADLINQHARHQQAVHQRRAYCTALPARYWYNCQTPSAAACIANPKQRPLCLDTICACMPPPSLLTPREAIAPVIICAVPRHTRLLLPLWPHLREKRRSVGQFVAWHAAEAPAYCALRLQLLLHCFVLPAGVPLPPAACCCSSIISSSSAMP